MQGLQRRIVYASLYELIAVAITSTALYVVSSQTLSQAGFAAVVSSLVALVWNFVYNSLFERWEARQATRGRGLARRLAHACGFEVGLVVMLVPFFAWSLQIGLVEAFMLDLGLIVFFLVYTFVFNLAFDNVFGLPASARSHEGTAST